MGCQQEVEALLAASLLMAHVQTATMIVLASIHVLLNVALGACTLLRTLAA